MREHDESQPKENEVGTIENNVEVEEDSKAFVFLSFLAKYKWALIILGLFIIFLVMLCIANQAAQASDLLFPGHGKTVLLVLLLVPMTLMVASIICLCRFRPTLIPPKEDSPDVKKIKFRRDQLKRLGQNKQVKPDTREKINKTLKEKVCKNDESGVGKFDEITDRAFNELDKKAKKIVNRSSQNIGMATALSQFGAMDAWIVAGVQITMINKLARLYYSRPKLIEIFNLYLFVGGSSFIAYKAEGLTKRISEALTDSIPILKTIASSSINGITNYLLTMRIGYTARKYCKAGSLPDKKSLQEEMGKRLSEWIEEAKRHLKLFQSK